MDFIPLVFFTLLSTRYDPDIDGPVPPRALAKAKEQRARAENEAEAGDAGDVNTKDVTVMYLVMRERVAKMEARVDERLNQVRAEHASPQNIQPNTWNAGGKDAVLDVAAAGQVDGAARAAERGPGHVTPCAYMLMLLSLLAHTC